MKPRKTSLLAAMLTILFSVSSRAQDCQPLGKFTDKEGEAGTIAAGETYAGSAPLTVTFSANPPSGHDPATNYEWHFFNQNNPREAYLIRYDAINVSISESSLQMPNAFSPNGDGINDVYRAKPGYKSIVSFKAVIFNRWGQKLYEWDDPAGGWDGKYRGREVAQGTYFVNVTAKGADGREFRIRRDVNLLRGYTQAAH